MGGDSVAAATGMNASEFLVGEMITFKGLLEPCGTKAACETEMHFLGDFSSYLGDFISEWS
jgi:hypothetical protein